MDTAKGTRPVIPLNEDYEKLIFNERNIDEDCDYIAHLMWDEVEVIEQLVADGQYMEASMKFMQMTKSMCRHFVLDEHYCYFDDMYSPEYAIFNLVKLFNGLAQGGRLPDEVKEFLRMAWAEIKETECYTDYGYPNIELMI